MQTYSILLSGCSRWYKSLAAVFSASGIFQVIEKVDSENLVEMAESFFPDIVLWKLEENDCPVSVITDLKLQCPFTCSIILVRDPNSLDLPELLRVGLKGCLPLRLFPRQIVNAVELIVKTGVLCLPRMEADLFDYYPKRKDASSLLHTLTGREQEVLSLLGKNFSNQEIAGSLFLSESTVKTHLRNIFRKLGVRNRSEALTLSFQEGFLKPKERSKPKINI